MFVSFRAVNRAEKKRWAGPDVTGNFFSRALSHQPPRRVLWKDAGIPAEQPDCRTAARGALGVRRGLPGGKGSYLRLLAAPVPRPKRCGRSVSKYLAQARARGSALARGYGRPRLAAHGGPQRVREPLPS